MEAILLGVQVFIAIALIVVVLIQRSDQDGFGLGSGSGANFMTGRQSANLLTRTTGWLAAAFMLNCLILTIMAAGRSETTLLDRIEAAGQAVPAVALEDAAADLFGDVESPTAADGDNEVVAPIPAAPIAE
jgi:preprotein translocase subunit SecG